MRFNILLIFTLFPYLVYSQQRESKATADSYKLADRTYTATRFEGEIKIDGIGNESVWDIAKWASDFWMWRPTDSLLAKKQTRFKYDTLFIIFYGGRSELKGKTQNGKECLVTYSSDAGLKIIKQ